MLNTIPEDEEVNFNENCPQQDEQIVVVEAERHSKCLSDKRVRTSEIDKGSTVKRMKKSHRSVELPFNIDEGSITHRILMFLVSLNILAIRFLLFCHTPIVSCFPGDAHITVDVEEEL